MTARGNVLPTCLLGEKYDILFEFRLFVHKNSLKNYAFQRGDDFSKRTVLVRQISLQYEFLKTTGISNARPVVEEGLTLHCHHHSDCINIYI